MAKVILSAKHQQALTEKIAETQSYQAPDIASERVSTLADLADTFGFKGWSDLKTRGNGHFITFYDANKKPQMNIFLSRKLEKEHLESPFENTDLLGYPVWATDCVEADTKKPFVKFSIGNEMDNTDKRKITMFDFATMVPVV